MAAFEHAVSLGVPTLECDVNVSADGVAVVTHDRVISPQKNRDTGPIRPDDPDFPYVGRFISRLSYAQIRTIDAGSLCPPAYPDRVSVPGERMPRFEQVLGLARDTGLRVNVEAKFDVLHPREVRPRETFVRALLRAIEYAGMVDVVAVQSFDWQVLKMIREASPATPRYALTAANYQLVGEPGASPWLAGLDIDDYEGDVTLAASKLGFRAISPNAGKPNQPTLTRDLIDRAHRHGLLVVPYTVDDPEQMRSLVDLGCDGLITNYPDRAIALIR